MLEWKDLRVWRVIAKRGFRRLDMRMDSCLKCSIVLICLCYFPFRGTCVELLLSEEESGRLIANWTELNVIKPKLNSFRAGGGQVRGSIVEAKIDDSIALEARDVRVGVLRQ